jgi:hypothetical protein
MTEQFRPELFDDSEEMLKIYLIEQKIYLNHQDTVIHVRFYLYVSVVSLIDYSDIDKMMVINNEKC